jgi:metal-sulfur cluster biosynthetic enzyme
MASGEGGVMTEDLVARIKQALQGVIDPELGYNIVDLGFLYEVTVKQGDARILMTATTRACPAAAFLKEGVAASAAQVEGVRSVDVEMTFDPPWTPSRIDPAVRSSLGFANVN